MSGHHSSSSSVSSDEEDDDDVAGRDSVEEDVKPLLAPPLPNGKKDQGPVKEMMDSLSQPLYEEEIIEGFSFASFKTYDDLEVSEKVLLCLALDMEQNKITFYFLKK